MDFVHDQLIDGRPIRMLTVVDQRSRECVLIEPAFSFSGRKVAEVLEWPVIHGGALRSITVDHGPEFTSIALEEWAYRHEQRSKLGASTTIGIDPTARSVT